MVRQKSFIVFTDGEPDGLVALLVLVKFVQIHGTARDHVLVVAQESCVSQTAQSDVQEVVGDNVTLHIDGTSKFNIGEWCVDQIQSKRSVCMLQIAPVSLMALDMSLMKTVSEIHIQGGTLTSRLGSQLAYNWDNNIKNTAELLRIQAGLPKTKVFLYSPNLDETVFGGSMTVHNAPNAIGALLRHDAPAQTHFVAGKLEAHDRAIIRKMSSVTRRIGGNFGKQLCPSDVLVVCGGVHELAVHRKTGTLHTSIDVKTKKLATSAVPKEGVCLLHLVESLNAENIDLIVKNALWVNKNAYKNT